MSEEERKRRLSYRQMRQRYIKIQAIVLIVALILTVAFAALAIALNKTHYVNYTEKSSVDYGVHLKPNEFYEESFLGKDYAYIASLIDRVEASFNYGMNIDSKADVSFVYTYSIDSVIQIRDVRSGKLLYSHTENELPNRTQTVTGSSVDVKQTVFIDYAKYNDVAERFIDKYKLRDTTASLILQMNVSVVGASEEFHNSTNTNSYVSSISIPLTSDTVEVKITSMIPAEAEKILSYTTENIADVFRTIAIIFLAISVIIALILILYVYASRNVDITYEIRVKRLLSAYKSFIQRLQNEFDTSGYQLLMLSAFNEMLEIRDTIQSPILMYENSDKTCTRFLIPTNTKILYVYELKVADYDEIYGASIPEGTDAPSGDNGSADLVAEAPEAQPKTSESAVLIFDTAPEATVEETVTEESLKSEEAAIASEAPTAEQVTEEISEQEQPPIDEEAAEQKSNSETEEIPACEACAPSVSQENGVETAVEEISEEPLQQSEAIKELLEHIVEIDDDSEDGDSAIACVGEDGNLIKIICSRSFTSNLIQSNPQVKHYYNELKNHILSYKGVKSRVSWRLETYKKGRIQLFKMKIRGKTICLYCALDPEKYDRAKFFHEKSEAKVFASVPMMVRIKSDRGLKRAKGLIDDVMKSFSIPPIDNAPVLDYAKDYPYETTKVLVEKGLIKILLPGSVAAEPKPHHHVHKKVIEVVREDSVEEMVILDSNEIENEEITEIIEAPTPSLSDIDYDDSSEQVDEGFLETEEHPGIDVIGVVWPERPKRNKIYRYDPDGECVSVGDIVIVPTYDASKNRHVVRKAAVAHANHKIDPDTLKFPVKKIIGVLHTKHIDSSDENKTTLAAE